MSFPIQLLSTDFDGTLFAEFENPPVPPELQAIIADWQSRGVKWVINTGRDMAGLLECMARARLAVHPDYLVLVEREIFMRQGHRYVALADWNERCTAAHEDLFARVRPEVSRLMSWISERFDSATLYADSWSPFCLIAESNGDADAIQSYLEEYIRGVPDLTFVRNDVYARFSHAGYNKGSALSEIARQLGVAPAQIVAAGDHFNDLPMLKLEHAAHLVTNANAMPSVKDAVRRQGGFVSARACGLGVAEGLARIMAVGA